jgi:hypothetical protein
MPAKLTTEQFIKFANNIHKNKYNYSKVRYINSNIKVCIICSQHGSFLQKPYNHLSKHGCPKCRSDKMSKLKTLTNKDFLKRLQIKRPNSEYDYSKINYINTNSKITIICPKHGEFLQLPGNHLNGQNCPKCGLINQSLHSKKSTSYFVSKSNSIHNNKYDYSKSIYLGYKTKLDIICIKHGIFKQYPGDHLKGSGCKKCRSELLSTKLSSNTKEFIKRCKKIHENKYDYSKSNYTKKDEKVIIICPKHGEFKQTANNHIRGQNCPKCTYKISKPEIEFLDYINIKNRHVRINPYNVDGIDYNSNTIYEFLGDFYHGNPNTFDSDKYNSVCHKTYGELYSNTLKKFKRLTELGFNIKYIWENNWNKFKTGIDKTPNIESFPHKENQGFNLPK